MNQQQMSLGRPFVATALSLWMLLSPVMVNAGHNSEQPCPDTPLPADKQGLLVRESGAPAGRLGNFAKIRVPVDLNPSPVETAIVRSIYIIGDRFNAIEVGWKWDALGLFATDADTRLNRPGFRRGSGHWISTKSGICTFA